MKKVLAALKLVIADVAQLQFATKATAVATVVTPIVVAVLGVPLTAAEVGGWLLLAGGADAAIEKLMSGKAAAALSAASAKK